MFDSRMFSVLGIYWDVVSSFRQTFLTGYSGMYEDVLKAYLFECILPCLALVSVIIFDLFRNKILFYLNVNTNVVSYSTLIHIDFGYLFNIFLYICIYTIFSIDYFLFMVFYIFLKREGGFHFHLINLSLSSH